MAWRRNHCSCPAKVPAWPTVPARAFDFTAYIIRVETQQLQTLMLCALLLMLGSHPPCARAMQLELPDVPSSKGTPLLSDARARGKSPPSKMRDLQALAQETAGRQGACLAKLQRFVKSQQSGILPQLNRCDYNRPQLCLRPNGVTKGWQREGDSVSDSTTLVPI